jgi:hypothetical protein
MTLPGSSPLVQGFLLEAQQWRHQVGDDALRAGLDLDRHGHSGGERDVLAVDLIVVRSSETCAAQTSSWPCGSLALSVFALLMLPGSVGGLR